MPFSTEDAIAQRRATVARLYLQGWTQSAIAANQQVTQGQISQDLHAIRDEWRESALMDFNEHKIKELAKLDHLEATLWAAWEQSLKPIKKKTVKKSGKLDIKLPADKQLPSHFDQTDVEEGRLGDPRYLEGIQRCIQKRCDLLGLDAPLKLAPLDPAATQTGKHTWVIQDNTSGRKVPAPDDEY